MTWLIVAAIAVLVVVLVVVGAWAIRTANRLDRLNVRYDLSWQALDGALARRAVVARAVAIDAYGGAGRASGWRRWPTPPRARPGMRARTRKTSSRRRWRWSIRRRCRRA